jgi:hypothetical protein
MRHDSLVQMYSYHPPTLVLSSNTTTMASLSLSLLSPCVEGGRGGGGGIVLLFVFNAGTRSPDRFQIFIQKWTQIYAADVFIMFFTTTTKYVELAA